MKTAEKAETLRDLHQAPEILRVVNVWDAIATKIVAGLPATKAIATAGHSIAGSLGYEDGKMPLQVALTAAEAEKVHFQLNARTDAIARGTGPLDERLIEAIKRGRAFLAEGAALVFIPGLADRESIEQVVAELGRNTVSIIGLPGALTAAEYQDLGIARISYGPLVQRVTLLALQNLATDLYGSGVIPVDLPVLN